MNKDEVLSVPAGSTYALIKKWKIHACPPSYTYRDSEYITFRDKDGYMEDIYDLSKSKIIHIDPFDKNNLKDILEKNYPDCLNYLSNIDGYIKERKEEWKFSQNDFRFYILVDTYKQKIEPKAKLKVNIQ